MKKKSALPLKHSLLMGAATGLLIMFLSYFNLLGGLENSSYDHRLRSRGPQPPAPGVLIVGVTEECLDALGRWPWEREVHGRLLDALTEGGASVVGMDFIITEPSTPEYDRALVEATARSSPVVYASYARELGRTPEGFFSPQAPFHPLPGLLEHAETGYINVIPDRDGIMRHYLLWMDEGGDPAFPFGLLVWARSRGLSREDLQSHLEGYIYGQAPSLPLGDFWFPLDLERGTLTLVNVSGGPGNIPMVPYHQVLAGGLPPDTFQDKIVLVGYYALGLGDYYFTPYARNTPMFGVEFHANFIHSILRGGPIHQLPLGANLLMFLALALVATLAFQALRPQRGFLLLLSGTAALYVGNFWLFSQRSLYLELVYPLLALGICYGSSLAYGFIMERRDRERVTRIFSRYVASQVVDEILDTGEENLKLGGTRREITLFFIDIRGFTPLSEKLSPEEVVGVLNEYFDIVTRCIFENKGTIDKFMGDAVMALFNAPLLLEDHSLWAVQAARDITRQGKALQEKIKNMSGVDLYFGIGINTGDAVVGNIGSQSRMEYTAIGDAVNLAARLESNAKPGQVLVSETVYQNVGNRIPLEPVGEIMVKGKSKPVKIFQLKEES